MGAPELLQQLMSQEARAEQEGREGLSMFLDQQGMQDGAIL